MSGYVGASLVVGNRRAPGWLERKGPSTQHGRKRAPRACRIERQRHRTTRRFSSLMASSFDSTAAEGLYGGAQLVGGGTGLAAEFAVSTAGTEMEAQRTA